MTHAATRWDAAAQVGFHDAECGGYGADLAVWRGLAASAAGPVLDIGAGTGRVSLDLAAAGVDVTALDVDDTLLAALRARAAARGLAIPTVVADAQALPDAAALRADAVPEAPRGADAAPGAPRGADAGFALVLVPMQTVQLLDDRPALLRGIRRLLRPGGSAALAIADELVGFAAGADVTLPDPDVASIDGWRYESQPLAVRIGDHAARIERARTAHGPAGERVTGEDLIELRALHARTLHAEGAAAGLRPAAGTRIAPTDEHVGSTVVVLRA